MKSLFLILSLIATISKAQVNLVPNPSFEENTACPDTLAQLFKANNWFSPTLATPDYFHECSLPNPPFNFPIVGVPQKGLGYEYASDGLAHAGIISYYKPNIIQNYTEYIAVELSDELKPQVKYCVSLKLSCADSTKYKLASIGLDFSNTYQFQNIKHNLPNIPEVIFDALPVQKIGWTKLTAEYVAAGGEKYITIGNFLPYNALSIDSTIGGGGLAAYYFIDEVYVGECPIGFIPNVISPDKDGLNEFFVIENLQPNSQLTIHNRWGNVVYQSNNYQNNWDGENLSDGGYYYILQLPFGTTKKGTVTILKN